MLALLKIKNLALVDELVWEPSAGFLGITGETGAGKSVIMGGISLALGDRADKGMIRSGESQCSLEAIFALPNPAEVNRRLEEAGVPPCEEGTLIIRRVITASGNRQFINNTPVTLNLLRQISTGLVDMHHPDSHRSLTSQQRQLALLDAFAEAEAQRQGYEEAYRAWTEAKAAHRALLESEAANEREIDYLRHQIEEIEQAGFSEQEVSGLEERWLRARNASRLRDTAMPLAALLDGDEQAAIPRLRQAVRQARELERWDAAFASRLQPLREAVEALDEVAAHVQDYVAGLSTDPAGLAELEERIGLLDTLKRKYGTDFEEIQRHLEDCREKLESIENRDARLEELAAAVSARYEELQATAEVLSEKRRKSAPHLAERFLEHAAHLGFRQALFEVSLKPLSEPSPHGAEEVEFLFGPNPGEPLKALRLIASSGELARVMLALKSALAKQDDTPLLVFDEIDANVGGEIARAVGRKMLELGRDHQVIAITHFPQVAALADHHYLISKGVAAGRTVSQLREVSGEERVQELVRMLGSAGATAEAHARELLSRNEH